jgi:hypothetical protein
LPLLYVGYYASFSFLCSNFGLCAHTIFSQFFFLFSTKSVFICVFQVLGGCLIMLVVGWVMSLRFSSTSVSFIFGQNYNCYEFCWNEALQL